MDLQKVLILGCSQKILDIWRGIENSGGLGGGRIVDWDEGVAATSALQRAKKRFFSVFGTKTCDFHS